MIPYGLVDQLNDTQIEMIGMKPKDAIVLEEVPLVDGEVYPEEDKLPEDGLYRYLLHLVKNTMIIDAEQQTGYGLKRLTD